MKIGFRAKVLLAISVISILTSVLISVVYFNRSVQMVEQNYVRSLWNTLSVSMETYESTAQDSYNIAVRLANDEKLSEMLAEYGRSKGNIDEALGITAYLKQFQPDGGMLDSIYIYLPEQKQVITSIEYHGLQEIFLTENYPWLNLYKNDSEGTALSPAVIVDRVSRAPKHVLTYSRNVYNREGTERIAIVAVNLDERKLSYQLLSNSERLGENRYYLIDPTGVIASGVGVSQIGSNIFDQLGVDTIDITAWNERPQTVDVAGDLLVASVRSSLTGYRIVCVANRSELVNSLKKQQGFVLTLLTLTLFAMLMLASAMSKWMYKPVRLLKDAMERVSSGDLSARTPVIGGDEIAVLGKGFNETIDRVESLISELVNERLHKKEAELEALQYQITPHFMYNTLNSIKYAAVLQGADRLGEQLGAFIELLQASISRKGAFLTVQEEFRMVDNYVKLQQFRYMCSFEVVYTVQDEVKEMYVPRLLLQPLVENAILHGGSGEGMNNLIELSAAVEAELLVFSISDNGNGMTEEQVQALMRNAPSARGHFSGIGVANIRDRLRLYYGDRAELSFSSSPGEGTCARIQLPISFDADEYAI